MTILACVLALAAFEVCDHCSPGKTDAELCAEHRAEEEGVIARHRPLLASGNVDQRLASLTELIALNHGHENAPSRKATRAVAAGLADSDARVREAAAFALTDRQHVVEAVRLLDQALRESAEQISRSNATVQRAMDAREDRVRRSETQQEPAPQIVIEVLQRFPRDCAVRAVCVRALTRIGNGKAEDSVVQTLLAWDVEAETKSVSLLVALDSPDTDPLGSGALLESAVELGTRRCAEALCKLQPKIDESQWKLSLPPMGDFLDPKGNEAARARFKYTWHGERSRTLVGDRLRKRLIAELGRLGERPDFSPPPEDGATLEEWTAWTKRNLHALPVKRPATKDPAAAK